MSGLSAPDSWRPGMQFDQYRYSIYTTASLYLLGTVVFIGAQVMAAIPFLAEASIGVSLFAWMFMMFANFDFRSKCIDHEDDAQMHRLDEIVLSAAAKLAWVSIGVASVVTTLHMALGHLTGPAFCALAVWVIGACLLPVASWRGWSRIASWRDTQLWGRLDRLIR